MRKQNTIGKAWLAGLALAGIALLSGPASAVTNVEAKTSSTNKITVGGDFRLRHESFFNKSAGQQDRNRERFRLRFGVNAEMEKWDAGFRLASGTGEQTSTNQTLGNGWNQKNIYIDQAFATYKPFAWGKIRGGKMENPFWRNYASDLIWDADLNPEGLAEMLETDVNDFVTVFGNFAQLPINEINGDNPQGRRLRAYDPWLFGNQIGVKTKLGGGVRWNFGLASYSVTNETNNVLLSTNTVDSPVQQGDNTRVNAANGLLAGAFHMLHLNTELGFQALLPIRVQADFVRNVDKERYNNAANGYQVGFILNSAKNAGGWELAYFNKYSEANATLSDFADSDWGNGGTNRKGHIVWAAYSPTDFLTFQGKYFMTKRANSYVQADAPYRPTTTFTPRDINRFQLDAVVKF